jgi:acetyl-CoA carboxylase carboxyltransferase component
MWPNAKICVMGPDQLASVMQTVSGKGKTAKSVEEQEKSFGELRGRIERESSALYSTARIWVSWPYSLLHCLHDLMVHITSMNIRKLLG